MIISVSISNCCRDQLKITLKIFLPDSELESLYSAVRAALAKLATNRVDILLVATPVEVDFSLQPQLSVELYCAAQAFPHIGIGAGDCGGVGRAEAVAALVRLWRGVEQLVGEVSPALPSCFV